MEDLFGQLQDDTRSFWQSPSAVQRLDRMPSPTTFFREYVATSTPVIISGGASAWKAMRSWEDLAFLAGENPELEVTVDFTPDGRGDCVVDVNHAIDDQDGGQVDGDETPAVANGRCGAGVFVKPEERRVTFERFVGMLSKSAAATDYEDGGGSSFEPDSCSGDGDGAGNSEEVPYLSHQVGTGARLQGYTALVRSCDSARC